MAYEIANPVQRIGPQGSGNSLWMYVDGDTLAVIDGVDYFLLEVDRLKVDDVIIGVGNNVAGFAVVNAVSATSIDVSNFAAQTTIDSD